MQTHRPITIFTSFLAAITLLGITITTSVLAQTAESFVKDEPFFEVTDIFEAGRDGYMTYRIPSLAVTRKGTILAICSARFDGHGDWVNIDSMIRRKHRRRKNLDRAGHHHGRRHQPG